VVNSHTNNKSAPKLCHLGRVQSIRSPPKRRRIGVVPVPTGSYVSLLHDHAGKSHCSPALPVPPAGNVRQTHTTWPSGPVPVLRRISPSTTHQIRRN
jgi:hypothetical protein